MKKILFVCFILPAFTTAFAQSNKRDTGKAGMEDVVAIVQPPSPESDTNKAFVFVAEMPRFNGDVNNWLAQNIHYPEEAVKAKIVGTVYMSFIVELDGSVTTVKVLRTPSDILSKEATRVVSIMPKWIPGKQNGKTVRVMYTLPIKFRLT